ncbi:hypothetical protein Tco_1371972, partial [Tanacetum coccineum]
MLSITYLNEDDYDLGKVEDLIFYNEAINSNQSTQWLEAMNDELKSMQINDVWELAELPNSVKPVGYLGEASYVIGIEIYRDRSRKILGLSQRAYIDKILKKYNMQNCSPTVSLVVKGDKFGAYQCRKNKVCLDLMEYEEQDVCYMITFMVTAEVDIKARWHADI